MSKITPRSQDYSQWYIDIVRNAKLADYAPVKGCMVIRPNGYAIWEKMQAALDGMFKATGHVNAYFPLFIPQSFLSKEAQHVEGFAKECALVTHSRLVATDDGVTVDPTSKLEEPLVVRPTSETVIWSMYREWVQSYRDLPILINQWANVVRWEMRTRLFLRTTEFLWQEGHTAHATEEEAEAETRQMLDVYARFAEEYMAVPVVKGVKTESEKFAGAVRTYSIEAMMQDHKALQAGTSHYLGQNFAKAFDVKFQDRDGEVKFAYATSWGVSTRLIGALIMAHSDDRGLVLPPKMAATQVVIMPIGRSDEDWAAVLEAANRYKQELTALGIGVKVDEDRQHQPGWRYAEYELQGIPVRIEVGPKDLAKESVMVARRDTGEKTVVPQAELRTAIPNLLTEIQNHLLERARQFRDAHIFNVDSFDELKGIVEPEQGWANAHWCGSDACEAKVKDETKATIRCIPFDRAAESGRCVVCDAASEGRVLFAKAY